MILKEENCNFSTATLFFEKQQKCQLTWTMIAEKAADHKVQHGGRKHEHEELLKPVDPLHTGQVDNLMIIINRKHNQMRRLFF